MPERIINDDYVRLCKSMTIKELVKRREILIQKLSCVPPTSGSIKKALKEQIKDLDYFIQSIRLNS